MCKCASLARHVGIVAANGENRYVEKPLWCGSRAALSLPLTPCRMRVSQYYLEGNLVTRCCCAHGNARKSRFRVGIFSSESQDTLKTRLENGITFVTVVRCLLMQCVQWCHFFCFCFLSLLCKSTFCSSISTCVTFIYYIAHVLYS